MESAGACGGGGRWLSAEQVRVVGPPHHHDSSVGLHEHPGCHRRPVGNGQPDPPLPPERWVRSPVGEKPHDAHPLRPRSGGPHRDHLSIGSQRHGSSGLVGRPSAIHASSPSPCRRRDARPPRSDRDHDLTRSQGVCDMQRSSVRIYPAWNITRERRPRVLYLAPSAGSASVARRAARSCSGRHTGSRRRPAAPSGSSLAESPSTRRRPRSGLRTSHRRSSHMAEPIVAVSETIGLVSDGLAWNATASLRAERARDAKSTPTHGDASGCF